MRITPQEKVRYREVFDHSEFIKKVETLLGQLYIEDRSHVAVMFMVHIKNLTQIRLMHGFDYAENCMQEVMSFFQSHYTNSIISRTGGAFFSIFCPKCNEREAKFKATMILNQIQFIEFKDKEIMLQPIIGSSFLKAGDLDIMNSLENSYAGVNISVNNPLNYYTSFSDANKRALELQECTNDLIAFRTILLNKRIFLSYQPIVSAITHETLYYECLMRIKNLDGTISSAGKYIEIAEKMNFINIIDESVLEQVIDDLQNYPDIKLSFNISAVGILNENWLSRALEAFSNKQIASRVIIEITETSLQQDLNVFRDFIGKMRDLGCKIAIDDFGVGNTTFLQIRHLDLDIVKIDGSYIKNILTNPESEVFVEALVKLSKIKNFKLVAEFVENEDIANKLKDMGVGFLQGHHFGASFNQRPWLKEQS